MSIVSQFFPKQKVTIRAQVGATGTLDTTSVEFDASLMEEHGAEAEVTDHPVEVGANVTDNIRDKPKTITINGVITDTPIMYGASFRNSHKRSKDAHENLLKLLAAKKPVVVATNLRRYQNMALQSVKVTRDKTKSNAVYATVTLKEIFTTKTLSYSYPTPKEPHHAPKKSLGAKPTTPEPLPDKSALFGLSRAGG